MKVFSWSRSFIGILILFWGAGEIMAARDLLLYPVRFDPRREVEVSMLPTRHIPGSSMTAKVRLDQGQARVRLESRNMKPAILFGGEVTSFVVWAVNRDGAVQNLGEFWVRPGSGRENHEFSTGFQNFALMVTAESYYQVSRPSEFVLFWNDKTPNPPVITDELMFTAFDPSPAVGIDNLANVDFTGRKPVELIQAERVFELAQRVDGRQYAPDLYSDAELALEQATLMYDRNRSQGAAQFGRRSVAAANEAILLTLRKKEVEELERRIAERRQQMGDLETRAREAEESLEQSRLEKIRFQSELDSVSGQLDQVRREHEMVQRQRVELASELEGMRREQAQLQESMRALREEREMLQSRLQDALSLVADTRDSARGIIVNLPDILFDVDRATIKTEAQIVLAKLTGILLIMRDLNLRVEGHTDSTGSAEYNLRLSRQRADSVYNFLVSQGIDSQRIITAGYGLTRPIADNSTAAGRQQNRRVEIVIARGEVAE